MQATMQRSEATKSSPISDSVDRSADYDIVIMGGAFSGTSSAILLKRKFPDLRVLIIERSVEFDRKVGESTSEVAGCFLTRVLKLGMHLSQKHVMKHGLRMWFHRESDNLPGSSTEVGPAFQGRLPTFQLNRIKLDTKLLEEAEELGCEILRPATIKTFSLGGVGKNKLRVNLADGEIRELTAGWLIDASGKASAIAKHRKTWRSYADEHPTSAMWTRFKNVCHIDSDEGLKMLEGIDERCLAQRGYSTNHLMGYGWWSWIIPLDNGEVSAGVTWDQRLFTPPGEGTISERVKEHLVKHPIGKLMFEDAEAVENDNKYYKGLSYYTEEVSGNGWTIVGDAAGFMDPLYSQGLDYCAHTVYSSFTMLRDHFSGECVKGKIEEMNREFKRSYFYWFDAIYRDKYWYMGDAELMNAAFLMDIATYFVGPVRLVYTSEDAEFSRMPYYGPAGTLFAKFMALYNRRLVVLAQKKIAKGVYGDKNLDHSFLVTGSFTPSPASMKLLWKGMKVWLKVELRFAFVKPSALGEPTMMTPLPESGDYEHA